MPLLCFVSQTSRDPLVGYTVLSSGHGLLLRYMHAEEINYTCRCSTIAKLDISLKKREALAAAAAASSLSGSRFGAVAAREENATSKNSFVRSFSQASDGIRTRTRPIQTHHGRTRQRLTARAVAEATTSEFHERMEPSHVKTTHSSSSLETRFSKRWLAHQP
ncbi:unnamed protein product [Trichogramma brassicae]|uniref:Uncharacterized protein n=1 Tax=Trichogramma brassicae TaxID=86971 RepID=A0A6H5IKC4_9HYME|nr:unnamed protein product [Trichogramma brassicae]